MMREKYLFLIYENKKQYTLIGSIILFKIVLMGLFSSDYQNDMFIPFVETFLKGKNPYSYYYENGLSSSFPYFPLMLLVESFGGMLISFLPESFIFLENILFKLPLLMFDIAGFYFIQKMNIRFKYASVFYFLSPIILYATYMHGQLDIIPTTLLIIAIYHLLNWKNPKNLFWYSIFLGLSLSTKLHILAAVPILFLYVEKKKDYQTALKYHLISLSIVLLVVIPFWGTGFIQNVLLNKEQSILFLIRFNYGSTQILIPFLFLMLIYLNVFELNYFNKNLLISMLGILFSIFLICIPPMPAWFIWIVPFITLYFGFVNEEKYKVMYIYTLLNIIYVVYFIFFHKTQYIDLYYLDRSMDYLKLSNTPMKSLLFTIMVSSSVMIIYKIYRFGVASNTLYQRRYAPFFIGIAGDSGAGKSRLMEKIEKLFGTGKDVLFIEGDGDHRWDRNDKNWEKYTALNPQANFLYRQAEDIRILKGGNHVQRSEYDHDTGLFTEKKRIKPKKYIVLCGLHSLYLPQLRKELDLKVFMDTDPELRKYWKIRRDMQERGYSKERVVRQLEKREKDSQRYIQPQKEYADMIIQYFDETLKNCLDDNHSLTLSVKFNLNINLDLENVIHSFQNYEIYPILDISDDCLNQTITFYGRELEGKSIDFSDIAEKNILQYEDFFTYFPSWGEGVEGIVQLFLLIMISSKMRG